MSISNYLENEILDHIYGAAAYSAPATLHIALFTTDPADDASGTEVTGNAYARAAVTNNATNFPAASGGSKSNGTVINFPTPTGSWGTVTHFAIFDATTAGNMLDYGALTTPKTIGSGDPVSFQASALTITRD